MIFEEFTSIFPFVYMHYYTEENMPANSVTTHTLTSADRYIKSLRRFTTDITSVISEDSWNCKTRELGRYSAKDTATCRLCVYFFLLVLASSLFQRVHTEFRVKCLHHLSTWLQQTSCTHERGFSLHMERKRIGYRLTLEGCLFCCSAASQKHSKTVTNQLSLFSTLILSCSTNCTIIGIQKGLTEDASSSQCSLEAIANELFSKNSQE